MKPTMIEFIIVIILWVGLGGYLSWKYKHQISEYVINHWRLPRLVNYLILVWILAMIEEILTCETSVLVCFYTTVPAFLIMMLPVYFIQKYLKLDYKVVSILFGVWGWVNEMLIIDRLHQLKSVEEILLISVFVVPIYSIIALIPSYYLQRSLAMGTL